MSKELNDEQYMSKSVLREEVRTNKRGFLFTKRIVDLILSILLFLPAIILIFIFSILIKLETKGPAFYRQERLGRNGRPFNIIKLRSMVVNAEKDGAQWASVEDPRITKVGKFIRNTRIDELPQLINVLVGDMSLIGPRPERKIFTEEFNRQIPGFKNRLQVKPGVTGWAQVNGGYDITPKEKLDLDMYYIQNLGIKNEITIFLKTIKVIITGHGAR